ncbi:MAG: hypothetical protein IMZ75_03335, partial [Actinobacteria bacterium]|nr:hypothetical protein [Actinomycetota bacterium]
MRYRTEGNGHVIVFCGGLAKIAGWEGIVCGLSTVYTSIAQVWNELYGRVVLPLG